MNVLNVRARFMQEAEIVLSDRVANDNEHASPERSVVCQLSVPASCGTRREAVLLGVDAREDGPGR